MKTLFCLMSLSLFAGCANVGVRDFPPPEQIRASQQVFATQAASGARADANLYSAHFDGGRLNSLGETKLSAMIADDDAAMPMRVYLAAATDDAALRRARHEAIEVYLQDVGLHSDQIDVIDGANPGAVSPADSHLKRMGKTESGSSDSEGAGAATPAQTFGIGK